jgi:hypothetical protein
LIASDLGPVLAPMVASKNSAKALAFRSSSEMAKESITSAASTHGGARSGGKEKEGEASTPVSTTTFSSSAPSTPGDASSCGREKTGKNSSTLCSSATSKIGGPWGFGNDKLPKATPTSSFSSRVAPPPTEAELPAPPSCGGISLDLALPSLREARRSSTPVSSSPLSRSAAAANKLGALLMVRTELATIVERRGEGDLDPEYKAARP